MPKPLRFFILILAVGAFAGVALAQNAQYNTGGPTANTLQLKLVEPAEGATITGPQVRVGVSYNTHNFGEGQGTKFGEANFPQPTFDIYGDTSARRELRGRQSRIFGGNTGSFTFSTASADSIPSVRCSGSAALA